jgi:hypothetical protein
LKTLYLALIGNEKGNHVEIKTIWRWIKNLINQVKNNSKFLDDSQNSTVLK